jgi:hypothetical protein
MLAWSMTSVSAQLPVGRLNRLLLKTPHPTLATVAAYVLARRGNRSSLRALLSGIDRAEPETQYRSAVGLSRLVDVTGPGYREFMQNPTPTLEYWRERGRHRVGNK